VTTTSPSAGVRLAASAVLGLVAFAALPFTAACTPDAPAGAVRASFLVLGDAGAHPDDSRDYPLLLRVARALSAEDRARPADALLVLGDNFYPLGLQSEELVLRVRETLARPWCRFVAPGGPRAAELAGACDLPPSERHPIPIHAVLGNHDVVSPGSPELQRSAIPLFVPNWRLAATPTELRELAPGVSLVLLDSEHFFAGGDTAPVGHALRSAPGPWRLVALHRPLLGFGASRLEDPAQVEAYKRRMQAAVADAGVAVHAVLAGHSHTLQLILTPPPAPPLNVISGSSSDTGEMHPEPLRAAGAAVPGFARLDFVAEGGAEADPRRERLVVTLYRLLPAPLDRIGPHRSVLARYAVDLAGNAIPE
jgi:3',5'-cyclic AMP phosphodiesterase CpdA